MAEKVMDEKDICTIFLESLSDQAVIGTDFLHQQAEILRPYFPSLSIIKCGQEQIKKFPELPQYRTSAQNRIDLFVSRFMIVKDYEGHEIVVWKGRIGAIGKQDHYVLDEKGNLGVIEFTKPPRLNSYKPEFNVLDRISEHIVQIRRFLMHDATVVDLAAQWQEACDLIEATSKNP